MRWVLGSRKALLESSGTALAEAGVTSGSKRIYGCPYGVQRARFFLPSVA
jgi:hypothetical protein